MAPTEKSKSPSAHEVQQALQAQTALTKKNESKMIKKINGDEWRLQTVDTNK